MRSSLRKLRGFSLGKHSGGKEKHVSAPLNGAEPRQSVRRLAASSQPDEIAAVSQDLKDMKECYDGLISSSAHTSNSAFEFSDALQDLGTCLLTKLVLNMDEDSGRVLIMLGKVQYELHKLFDHYRVQIVRTISTPSEVLLSELSNVEKVAKPFNSKRQDSLYLLKNMARQRTGSARHAHFREMKEQCHEKRKAYEIMKEERSKVKSKFIKGEHISASQLQLAKEDYEQQLTLLVCRLMSLKQGQPRSLLIQAARHYTAQLQLFRKGLAALEALEPHVKRIAEEEHIDFQLPEIEEDDGEISIEFSQNDNDYDDSSSSDNSMQLDALEESEAINESSSQMQPALGQAEHPFDYSRSSISGSKSAPLISSAHRKSGGIEKGHDFSLQQTGGTHRNLHTYALPTPDGARSGNLGFNNIGGSRYAPQSEAASASWHTSPLENSRSSRVGTNVSELLYPKSGPLLKSNDGSIAQPLPEEQMVNTQTNLLPAPLRFDTLMASDAKRIKRYGHSGPLAGKSWSSQSNSNASGPLVSNQTDTSKSIYGGRSSVSSVYNTSKISPNVSPATVSPPHVNKLYELPKPPKNSTDSMNLSRSSHSIVHSAPLMAKRPQETSGQSSGQTVSKTPIPLPKPPSGAVTRSFSIPSRRTKGQFQLPKISDVSERMQSVEEVASPPLTPILFSPVKGKLPIEEIPDSTVEPLDAGIYNNVQSDGGPV